MSFRVAILGMLQLGVRLMQLTSVSELFEIKIYVILVLEHISMERVRTGSLTGYGTSDSSYRLAKFQLTDRSIGSDHCGTFNWYHWTRLGWYTVCTVYNNTSNGTYSGNCLSIECLGSRFYKYWKWMLYELYRIKLNKGNQRVLLDGVL